MGRHFLEIICFLVIVSCTGHKQIYRFENSQSISVQDSGTFFDNRDGHSYKWVKIGKQVWMAENLAYLPTVSQGVSNINPCYYVSGYFGTNNELAKTTTNYNTYGALYNFVAAQTACPQGWHLPSIAEWKQLAEFISNIYDGENRSGGLFVDHYIWSEVGKHLKSKSGWPDDGNGTDDFGFKGLPGGMLIYNDKKISVAGINYYCMWMVSDYRPNEISVNYMELDYESSAFTWNVSINNVGMSVRCIRD